MPDIGLVNFVRKSRINGKTDEEITETLRQNNQNDQQIQQIFDAAAGLYTTNNEQTLGTATYGEFNPLKEQFAGFGVRLVAELVDMIPFLFLQLLPTHYVSLLYITYKVVMMKLYGDTIGKMVVGIKVISPRGESLSTLDVLLREVLGKTLSQLFLCAGYLLIIFTRHKQGLHDIIANTYVVYRRK